MTARHAIAIADQFTAAMPHNEGERNMSTFGTEGFCSTHGDDARDRCGLAEG
jgi:hypothetical protein